MAYYIPIALFVGSIIGILAILLRKLPTVMRRVPLAVDDEDGVQEGFWSVMFSEFVSWWQRSSIHNFRQNLIRIYGKWLRRTRIVLLKLENRASKWLAALPNHHEEPKKEPAAKDANRVSKRPPTKLISASVSETPDIARQDHKAEFQKEEKRLIDEIIRFPKNPHLYRRLGLLYLKYDNKSDAEEALRASLELDPGDDRTRKIFDELVSGKK